MGMCVHVCVSERAGGRGVVLVGFSVRKRPVKYRYLSIIYREIQSFLGPSGIPNN